VARIPPEASISVNAAAVGPFEPGINIVHAPNGTGKTTLFRAVSLATIEAHRSKAADIQALRPWGRRLSPYITIEFEHSGKIYRLRKHFLDGASAPNADALRFC